MLSSRALAEDALLSQRSFDGVPRPPAGLIFASFGIFPAPDDSQKEAVEAAGAQCDGQQGEEAESDAMAERKQQRLSHSGLED